MKLLIHTLFRSGHTYHFERKTNGTTFFRSVDHAVSVFLNFFGPTMLASETLKKGTKEDLFRDLRDVFYKYNLAKDGTAVIENRFQLTLADDCP